MWNGRNGGRKREEGKDICFQNQHPVISTAVFSLVITCLLEIFQLRHNSFCLHNRAYFILGCQACYVLSLTFLEKKTENSLYLNWSFKAEDLFFLKLKFIFHLTSHAGNFKIRIPRYYYARGRYYYRRLLLGTMFKYILVNSFTI